MRIIAFANQKGGVGKTTSVINCGAALVEKSNKVLAIDMDPQAHLTAGVGISPYKLEITIYDVLRGRVEPEQALIRLERDNGLLHLMPSSLALASADAEFSSEPGREFLLREAINKLKTEYDYVLIDCPPALGILTVNAFTAAGEIIIPLQSEYFAMHGTRQLVQIISKVQQRLNPGLKLSGVLITMYDSRKKIHQEIVESINKQFEKKVFKTLIRGNVALVESPSFGEDIIAYRPGSAGAEDYRAFVAEIIGEG